MQLTKSVKANPGFLKSTLMFLFLIACIFFLLGNITNASAASGGNLKDAPDFNLPVLNPSASGFGNFSLGRHAGHIIVLNFWATWCPPCRHEIPMLIRFYNKYRSKGVILVGINVNEDVSGVRSFIGINHIDYPVVYATYSLITNYGGIDEIPQTFFISGNGKIMYHWVGEISKDALYGITSKLLEME